MPCSQTTRAGKKCRGRPIPGSNPLLCPAHQGKSGRKSLLTPELREILVLMFAVGNHKGVVLQATGVAERTYESWLQKGDPEGTEPENELYRRFRAEVEQAQAEGEVRNIAVITSAAQNGNWKAAAWMAERQAPERWAKGAGVKPTTAEPAAKPPADPFEAQEQRDELAERRAASSARDD
jgi:hypothetical protein